MNELGKRFFITVVGTLSGYALIKLMMRLGDINPMGIAARVFNSIDEMILMGFKALAIIALIVIALLAAASLLESIKESKKKREDKQAKKIRDELERKILELREKKELKEKLKKAEEDRLRKLKLEQQRLAEIEHQKRRSAKEATQDSLSDYL